MIRLLTIMLSVVAFSAIAHPVLNDLNPPTYEGFEYNTTEPKFALGIVTVLEDNQYKDIFYYRGSIETSTTEVIQYFAKQYPHIKEIALNSPGGAAYESFELGSWFSDYGMSTTVPPGSICLSACAIAFIGGKDYTVNGSLGFHAAWIGLDNTVMFDLEQLNDAYGAGQLIGTQMSYFFRVNGFHDALALQIAAKTDAEHFIIFSHENELAPFFSRADDHPDTINHYIDYTQTQKDGVENLRILDSQGIISWMQDPLNNNNRGREVVRYSLLYPQQIPADESAINGPQ